NRAGMASQSRFETMPMEIVDHILSYLVHPRSRLPGLSEWQSSRQCPDTSPEKKRAKDAWYKNKTAAPDLNRWAVDLFSWTELRHPFNTLALTSKRCRELVENFCSHLVRANNTFNLPFPGAGTNSNVYPDLSRIVYRRLYLQCAPRRCVFCDALISNYPHVRHIRLLNCCKDCFYAQVFARTEIEQQYHLSEFDLQRAPIRGTPGYAWTLRVDVEALALDLYGTKEFHAPTPEEQGKPCVICQRARRLEAIRQVKLSPSVKKHSRRDSGTV
ncbi:hypothetical protein BCR34DRAFT_489165, partial [Clohesyomyces aquaticus]